jgi:hypothetical protein
MATRSTITVQNSDGNYITAYCHYDGYLSNNGKILIENYTSPNKVIKLVELGNIRALGPENMVDVFEENSGKYFISESLTKIKRSGEDYNYYFDGKKWWYSRWSYDFDKEVTAEAVKPEPRPNF